MIDLFAGTGAFSYVFEKKGVKSIFANDMCIESEKIYNLNHKIKLTNEDLNKIKLSKIPKHDLLCAGFPCQPFSIAGKKKGFDDTRSNVFWKLIKILKKYKPQIAILENVKNLQNHDNGNTFNIISNELKSAGYHFKYEILNTSELSKIPQNRERIYIVCFRDKKLCDKFEFDFKKVKNNKIKNYLQDNVPNKYYYTESLKVYNKIQENVTKNIDENVLYQYRRYYVRENKNNVCPTLTANMGCGGHNVPLLKDDKGIRKLTPRECFNLQGFPKNYKLPNLSDSNLYKLAGNAVSIPIVKLIADKIFEIL